MTSHLPENKSKAVKAATLAVFMASLLLLISQTVFAYPITGNAVKTEQATIGAGVTPDSFLYFLDKALDNINLAFTFDQTEKAKKGLNIARERLMEVREMVNENKLGAAQAAQREHAKALAKVQNSIAGIAGVNATQELQAEVEIEKELEEHEEEVETVTNELKVKIEVKGGITPEQQALVDSVLSLMQNKTGEVKIRIENKKGETKIKIKAETGKSEVEIEEETEALEEETGLLDLKREKAEEQIEGALEELAEVKAKLLEVNITELNITSVTELITQSEQKITEAQEAFNETKFGEAFGLANAAEQLAENAEEILEKALEREEEEKEEKEEEREIEVEIEEGVAKVKIKVSGNKLKYSIPYTTEAELLNDIAARTGLSLEEVKALAKIEVEEAEDQVEEEEEEAGEAEGKEEKEDEAEEDSGEKERGKEEKESLWGEENVRARQTTKTNS